MKKKLVGLAASAMLLGACSIVDGEEMSSELLAGLESTEMITLDEAKEIAFAHANVDGTKAEFEEEEYDPHHNEYDLEFIVDNIEYEYEIDAASGKIVEAEKEAITSNNTSREEADVISLDQAKEIAFDHAQVDGSKATFDDEEFDQDDLEYELEFKVDGVEYEYDIDAVTGEILKFESEKDVDDHKPVTNHQAASEDLKGSDDDRQENSDSDNDDKQADVNRQTRRHTQQPKQTNKPKASAPKKQAPIAEAPKPQTQKPAAPKAQEPKGITSERALAIALNHAGLSSKQISDLEIELDTDDGIRYFEVEFEVGDVEYEYEISADTGSILDVERD